MINSWMPKTPFLLIFVCCLFLQTPLPTHAADQESPIVFGGTAYSPPFQSLQSGIPRGFDIDVAQALGRKIGRPVEFRLTNRKKALQDLRKGRIDALVGFAKSERRSRKYDFSTSYLTQSYSLVVHAESRMRSFRELDQRRLLMEKHCVAPSILDRWRLDPELVPAKNRLDVLRKLITREGDAAIMPRRQGAYLIAEKGYDNLRVLPEEINPRSYGFAVRSGDEELLDQLNDGIEQLKASGELQRIYGEWFEDLEGSEYQMFKILSLTVFPALIVLFGLFFSSYKALEIGDYWLPFAVVVFGAMLVHEGLEFLSWYRTGNFPNTVNRELPELLVYVLGTVLISVLAVSRSDLQETSHDLEEKNQYLEGIIDSAQQMIFVKDWKGRFQFANETLAQVYDTTQAELLGKTDADFNPESGEVENFLEVDREVMRSGEKKEIFEERVTVQATGETRWYHTLKVPLFTDKPLEHRQVLGVSTDITERKRMRDQLEETLDEKETLLEEIHHRVKNNLQIIASMLRMELRNSSGDSSGLEDSIVRINSLALVHEHLYQSEDLSEVDFHEYIGELCERLKAVTGSDHRGVEIDVNSDVPDLSLETAVPCGLLVTELVTNSLQHGLNGEGSINVNFESRNGNYYLTVEDNGRGFPDDLNPQEAPGTGLEIIESIAEYEFNGAVQFSNGDGLKAEVILRPGEHV